MTSDLFISAPISLVYTTADGEIDEDQGHREVFVYIRKDEVAAWHAMEDLDETKVYLKNGLVLFVNITDTQFSKRMFNS